MCRNRFWVLACLVLVGLPVEVRWAEALDTCPGTRHYKHSSGDIKSSVHKRLVSRYEDPGLEVKQYAPATASHPRAIRCDARHLAGRPHCGQLDFANSNLTGYIYYSERTKHYFYEPDECLLRRLSSGQAASCLTQQAPLVFVGDSVTRYQYLAFIHWLVAGKYQHPFNGNESFTDAHGWHSGHNRTKTDWGVVWERVQQQLLTHAKQRGQQVTFKVEYDRWAHLEQLKFTLQEPKTKKKVRVYYYYTSCIDKRSVQKAADWALSQERNLTLLLASCAHYGDDCGSSRLDLVKDAKQSLPLLQGMLKGRGQLVWKACATVDRGLVAKAEGQMRQLTAKLGIPTYDVRALVDAALEQRLVVTWRKTEVAHFMQWVYADFNDMLLNYLCAS